MHQYKRCRVMTRTLVDYYCYGHYYCYQSFDTVSLHNRPSLHHHRPAMSSWFATTPDAIYSVWSDKSSLSTITYSQMSGKCDEREIYYFLIIKQSGPLYENSREILARSKYATFRSHQPFRGFPDHNGQIRLKVHMPVPIRNDLYSIHHVRHRLTNACLSLSSSTHSNPFR